MWCDLIGPTNIPAAVKVFELRFPRPFQGWVPRNSTYGWTIYLYVVTGLGYVDYKTHAAPGLYSYCIFYGYSLSCYSSARGHSKKLFKSRFSCCACSDFFPICVIND